MSSEILYLLDPAQGLFTLEGNIHHFPATARSIKQHEGFRNRTTIRNKNGFCRHYPSLSHLTFQDESQRVPKKALERWILCGTSLATGIAAKDHERSQAKALGKLL